MTTMNEKSRFDWLDMAKGYGMLLVIWAHLIDEGSRAWIYSFHMPLFFLLSGYVFSTKNSFVVFLRKKIKTMIIPYFGLGIPMVLYDLSRYYQRDAFSWDNCRNHFERLMIQNRFWTLWYIACLFWLNIFMYALIKYIRSTWGLLFVGTVMAATGILYYKNGGVPLPWNIDACLTASLFVIAGYCYKVHNQRVNEIIDKKWLAWVLFYVFSAFAGIACMIILARRWTFSLIRYIEENSMLYYAWHQTIMIPLVTEWLETERFRMGANSAWGYIVLYKLRCLLLILRITTAYIFAIKRAGM